MMFLSSTRCGCHPEAKPKDLVLPSMIEMLRFIQHDIDAFCVDYDAVPLRADDKSADSLNIATLLRQ
jgi:hypothetical protein